MRRDIVPGGVFPDYELPDHRGKRHRLSELQETDPLIVVLGRGGFCPKDRRQHEGLLVLHREMEVGYCRLVTIHLALTLNEQARVRQWTGGIVIARLLPSARCRTARITPARAAAARRS